MKRWLYRIAIALGLIAFMAAIWFGGPLIAFGETRPFGSVLVRLLIILPVLIIVAAFYGIRYWRKREAEKALEEAASEGDTGDSKVLGERMSEAIATLRNSSGRRNFLYELPWYIIIGPPGAGKTTALANSGLKFPLAGAGGAQAVAGVGGTRYCDWWFTEDAVLIDTAGRYTTQDSDSEADKKSWLSFLSLLKDNRAKQPINGVILAISVEDLVTLEGQELTAHATAIRKRLQEINEQLKIDFPVYVVFTKADLIAGFNEYFGNFTESRRRKVWGATFQTEDRKKNMVSEVPSEFDALVRRLTEETPDRLHEEPDPIARIAIFDFPGQFTLLKDRVTEFLNRIFEPTRYQVNANLRGFYFTSGTQEGTPIDQVLGAIARSTGGAVSAHQMSGRGRSYFLHDLLTKVIFAEAGWVSRDMAAVRRAATLRYGAFAAIGILSVGFLAAWGVSYAANKALIADTDTAVEQYRINADEYLTSNSISDVDLENVVGHLDTLRSLPVGYEYRNEATPFKETFGLSQRDRLQSASETTYRRGLERMFRSRLILQLERTIEQNMNDPIALYEPLKVYLMLGGKAPEVDKQLITAWMQREWQENSFPGPANRRLRQNLENHLEAMLDLGRAHDPAVDLNGPLVESAQRSLARMNMADWAYALIRSAAYSAPIEDFWVAARAGPDAKLVFETVDGSDLESLAVPGLFTYSGFNDFFLGQLSAIAEKLSNEQWVMGKFGEQAAVEDQFKTLGNGLLKRYARDFVDAWESILSNLRLKPMSADKPQYVALSAASSPTSPIRQLLSEIARETALTREPEEGELPTNVAEEGKDAASKVGSFVARRAASRSSGLARIGIDLAVRKSQARVGGSSGPSAQQIPGSNIEAQFRAYQMLFDGDTGQRPIDTLIQNLYEIYQSLVLAATNPSQADRATSNLQVQVATLRASASRLPHPLARMVDAAAEDFEGDAANTSIAQLNQMMNGTVTRPCEQVISNRYPFARKSKRDVPMSDFARLFAPNGIIDRFFAQNLSQLVDMSGDKWEWKQDTRLGRELSAATLREFQRAAKIRDAFFPQGGKMPGVDLTITPFSLHGQARQALLEINGQVVQSQQVGNLPTTMTWPGTMGNGSLTLSLLPEIRGRTSAANIQGPWALMRLLDAGSVSNTGDKILARFVLGGRDVAYTFQVASVANPFFLPALNEFSCPTGL